MMMFIILPIAAVVILWRRNLPDENRDDGTLNLKKALLARLPSIGVRTGPWTHGTITREEAGVC